MNKASVRTQCTFLESRANFRKLTRREGCSPRGGGMREQKNRKEQVSSYSASLKVRTSPLDWLRKINVRYILEFRLLNYLDLTPVIIREVHEQTNDILAFIFILYRTIYIHSNKIFPMGIFSICASKQINSRICHVHSL